jgi:hypothetical protein
MAQYSKQWCELNNLDSAYQFDIEEIAKSLPNNSYQSIICDGFGFFAIGNSTEFGTLLYFKNSIGINSPADIDEGEWVRFSEMIETKSNELKNKSI